MRFFPFIRSLETGFIFGLCAVANASVTMPAIFSDHAVFQKSDNVPVWGKAAPGEAVTVTLDKSTASVTADASGKWRVRLDLATASAGPFDLVVQGTNTLTIRDVLVGEVWACTGQSNMAFPLSAFVEVAKKEVPASANPLLRQFLVRNKTSRVPLDDTEGKWVAAAPETSGTFSAVAYFFGKQLQKELGVPVGLINSSVGGTVIETWMSTEALDADPELKAGREKAQRDRENFDNYADLYRAWQKQYDRMDRPVANLEAFTSSRTDTADWKTVKLPGKLSAAGLPDAGAVWIRRKIPVPSSDILPAKGVDLYLGNIRDSNIVYWNGNKTGQSDILAVDHRYGVRPNFVTEGENILAVRIFNPAGGIGIDPGNPKFQGNHYKLSGEWLAKAEFELPPLDEAARAALPVRPPAPIEPQNVASYLYNGMINPIIPYAIQGIIWYQGEGNWTRGFQYRTAFPLMIRDWRAKWGRGDIPFYFCQLANYMGHNPKPEESPYAEVREAQNLTLSVPKTGQAVLIDIGEEGNIHPADKQSVGDRLVRIAFANIYGKTLEFSGPVYDSMTAEGDKVRVRFKHAEGLMAKPMPEVYQPLSTDPKTVPLVRNSPGGEVEGFAVCGQDKQWKWATAKIEGDSVVAFSPEVPVPIAVRYAWAQNPFCNLYNGAGLPASPFRTDDFPIGSQKTRY